MSVLSKNRFSVTSNKYFSIIVTFILLLGSSAIAWQYYALKSSALSKESAQTPNAGSGNSATENKNSKNKQEPAGKRSNANGIAIAVTASRAKTSNIKTIQTSIGTVVPAAEVVVHSRVTGQLTRIFFEEGQWVKQGQLLAQIDPRSFEASLAQIQGQADRNKALLRNAEQDLERYLSLRTQSAISQQQIDSQKTLVEQYHGVILADQGALANAKLQLSFTQIIAPIEGRIGLRNVDAGNNISPTDAQGLAIITQVQPVNVVFTLPEDSLPDLLQAQATAQNNKRGISVEAWDKSNRQALAQGNVSSLDNRIDAATGTIKLKATFANTDSKLFPNQFVNLRLAIGEQSQTTSVPITAIQRGSQGTYVYVVQNEHPTEAQASNTEPTLENTTTRNHTVSVRSVKLGANDGNQVAIIDGLGIGELVVTQGVDKLREGAKVIVSTNDNSTTENTPSENNFEDKTSSENHKEHKARRQKS